MSPPIMGEGTKVQLTWVVQAHVQYQDITEGHDFTIVECQTWFFLAKILATTLSSSWTNRGLEFT